MAIEARIKEIWVLLDRVKRYNDIITNDSFELHTIENMKGNAKAICDQIKDEVDNIKDEIDEWQ